MQQPIIRIIVGIQKKDRGIGYQNDLLFKLVKTKKGSNPYYRHTIVMGRKTFESIAEHCPNRTNIVITRNADWQHEGVTVVGSLDEALAKAREAEQEEIFIIGGSEIYSQALPFAHRLYLTLFEGEKNADTFSRRMKIYLQKN